MGACYALAFPISGNLVVRQMADKNKKTKSSTWEYCLDESTNFEN